MLKAQEKVYLKVLKQVLQYKYFYVLLLIIVSILAYIRLNIKSTSKYSLNNKEFKLKVVSVKKKNDRYQVEVLGKEKVFLIQNIFPVTKKYITSKYKIRGKDVSVPNDLKNVIINMSINVLSIERKFKGMILFNDVYKMKEMLLKEVVLI